MALPTTTSDDAQPISDSNAEKLPSNPEFDTFPNGIDSQVAQGDKAGQREYPTGFRFAMIMLGLCLALLCVSLDRTIVATAVPKITSEFDSLRDVAWYGSAYLFTNCAFQLLFGKIYSRLSVKWTFIFTLALFEIGSAICGAAPNSTALIIGRAIAGIGCAGVNSGALIITSRCVPLRDRPKYTGFVSGVMGIAFIAAPTLGGAFTDNLSWRWCFYINLPLGAVTFLAILFLLELPQTEQQGTLLEHLRNLDIPGTLLFIPSILSLLLALQWAGNLYPWSDWRIILLLCVFGVSFAVWVFLQYYGGDSATVPSRVVAQRSISVGLFHITIVGAATFIVNYFVPIWFQAVKNYTPQESGINYLAVSVCGALFALVSGILTSRVGYYVPSMYIGLVFFSVGAGLMLRFDLDTTTGLWLGSLILIGTGIGFSFQVALIAAQTVLSDVDISIGTSVMILGQTLGGAVFLCVGQNVFQSRLLDELAIQAPTVDPAIVFAAGAERLGSKLSALFPQDEHTVHVLLECYNTSLRQVWIIVLVLVCISSLGAVGMEWVSVKKDTQEENVLPNVNGGDKQS